MASSLLLSLRDGALLLDLTPYKSLIWTLQYCTITRSNISFAISKLCQFMHALINLIGKLLNDFLYISKCLYFMVSLLMIPSLWIVLPILMPIELVTLMIAKKKKKKKLVVIVSSLVTT